MLARELTGSKVGEIGRHGKNLIIGLEPRKAEEGERFLLVHLGMTGQLYVTEADNPLLNHTHLVVGLSDGRRLVFRDPRRFGHLELCRDGRLQATQTLRNVGIDALSDEFTARKLMEILGRRTALVKAALFDQSGVAGLGNIYICEAMYRAGIAPTARCHELTEKQIKALHRAIRQVLREAVAAEGTTISDYVTGAGVPGGFQKRLRVYGRESQPCRRRGCGATIRRIVQSNRSTFYCPSCQRSPNSSTMPDRTEVE